LLACSWRGERNGTILKRLLLFCLPFVILFIAYFIYRKVTTGAFLYFPDIEARSPWVNFGTQMCIVVMYYIPRTLIPVNLLFRPPFPLVQSIGDPRLWFSAFALILIGLIALYLFRKRTEISFGIFWFFVTMAPTSTFIPLWDLIAERRVYLSMIGAAVMAESIFFYLWKQPRKPIRLAAVYYSAAIVILFSALTLMRNLEYQNPTRFWYKEHLYSPYNLENLHNYLFRLSQNNREGEVKKVLQNLDWDKIKEENEFIDTTSLDSLIRLMLNYRIEVEYASLLAKENSEKYPTPDSLNTYQLALMVQHRFKDAMEVIDQTLAMNRNHVDTLFNKAFIYRIFGHYKSAEECLAKAIRFRPNDIVLLEEQVELYRAMKKDTGAIEKKIESLRRDNKYASQIDLKSSL
ncbi:MAG: tetratricopeptide repeat protein, partial [Candidatus Hinthialibacter sp.]